ncbi:5-oxoprolinase subunit B family protein [Gandjariella thermophila]|uniref:Allophanate hydrolase n=1 Tax=Gandjariella thermophila TaxID=1931992 RepID=A0A4D4J695_9PSEU|nr:allophanate hydrolase subunit 1 [Gandjariella thermophila]GDY30994.1 allophanate hydrolase [Gandjariella thermophila]
MPRLRRCGRHAALVDVNDLEQVLDLHAELRRHTPAGVVEMVPAARTLLLRFDPARTTFDRLATDVAALAGGADPGTARAAGDTRAPVTVPVRYDGEDLAELAREVGMPPGEVVRRHTAGEYVVAFCGFAPGFGYLAGLDPALHVPRRAEPRTRVPAGAVAVADRYTGVYPRPSPGGWRIIGHTELAVWQPDRDPPALLLPGTRVRFAEVAP